MPAAGHHGASRHNRGHGQNISAAQTDHVLSRPRHYSSQAERSQRRRRNSRSNRRQREKPAAAGAAAGAAAAAASRAATRRIVERIKAGDRAAAWAELVAQPRPNSYHCTAMVAGCSTAAQIRELRELMAAASVVPDTPFLSALHAAWIALRETDEAAAVLQELAQTGGKGAEKRWRGLANVGLRSLLAEQSNAAADAAAAEHAASAGRAYLARLQAAGLARVEHFNIALAHCGEDEGQVDAVLTAMDGAGVERTVATVTTLFGRYIKLGRYDSAAAVLSSSASSAAGPQLSADEEQRLLAGVTNTLKRLCEQDAARHHDHGSGEMSASGACLDALVAHGMATTTHFNVCLGAVGSRYATATANATDGGSSVHPQEEEVVVVVAGEDEVAAVSAEISAQMQRMGAKNAFFVLEELFLDSKRSFCQDRLGNDIGKLQQKGRSSVLQGVRGCSRTVQPTLCSTGYGCV